MIVQRMGDSRRRLSPASRLRLAHTFLALAFGLSVVAGARAWSQEAGKKDEALDSLLEKLAGPADRPAPKATKSAQPDRPRARSDRPAKGSEPDRKAEPPKARERDQAKPGSGGTPASGQASKPSEAQAKKDSSPVVAPKDQ